MHEDDTITESLLKNLNKLAGESDFGDEEDNGFLAF